MQRRAGEAPLSGLTVLTLAVNAPGPVAAARLREMGARVMKVEPPAGDPLAGASPEWYGSLVAGQEVIRLNLKEEDGRARLHRLLGETDLLLTASRTSALSRLGLGWSELHDRYPRLSHTAIVGYSAPRDDPGHDLTYLAEFGLLAPPRMPTTLLADLAGAERAVSASLGALLGRERGRGGTYRQVSLADAASSFADPLRYRLTAPGGVLGGGLPGYNLYETREGWVALAALEPHFWRRLLDELGLEDAYRADLQQLFATRTAVEWGAWASERDLPLAALCEGT